jgi:hypothetical protein
VAVSAAPRAPVTARRILHLCRGEPPPEAALAAGDLVVIATADPERYTLGGEDLTCERLVEIIFELDAVAAW